MKNQIALILLLFLCSTVITAQTSVSCTTSECHDAFLEAEYLHGDLENDCENCHSRNSMNHPAGDGNEFELSSDPDELCFECHDQPNDEMLAHAPYSNGDCITCHSPHSSEYSSLLNSDIPGEVCAECHSIEDSANKFKHGPVISGQCTACHFPHQSEKQHLLSDNPPQLCNNCHFDKQELLLMTNVHAAYEGSCLDCHSPHNSVENYLVKDKLPDLCLGCHDTQKVEMANAKTVHKIINIEKSCVACHSPHANNSESLVLIEGNDLCFSCHNKEYKSKERKLKNIYNIVTKSKYKHEAVSEGECTNCHFTHASNNFFLLNGEFPFGSYAEGPKATNFGQCFICHDQSALELAVTDSATNFRDKTNNMHYLHITQNKGRNCTLCHNIHGSKNPHLIAEKVPFGKWQMPLNFKITEKGGSCLPGCHATLAYSRELDD